MNGVVWWEIETTEPERFQEFHSVLWAWTFEPAFMDTKLGADYWIIKADGVAIGGLQRSLEPIELSTGGARIYFEVDNLEAALHAITKNGGSIERRRTELGGDDRWFGIYRDPTGISFGLWTANAENR
jgi:predicted enzyme related to lactoylglutathione lyase